MELRVGHVGGSSGWMMGGYLVSCTQLHSLIMWLWDHYFTALHFSFFSYKISRLIKLPSREVIKIKWGNTFETVPRLYKPFIKSIVFIVMIIIPIFTSVS